MSCPMSSSSEPPNRAQESNNLSGGIHSASKHVPVDAGVFEDAQIPMVESDKGMAITNCNAATYGVFGYTREELIGERVNILMFPEDSRRHDGYIESYERTGIKKILATKGRTVVGRHKNGATLTLQLTTTSTPTGYAAVFVDMSSQVETERAFSAQQARADAEQSMKEFLAHEVRNPLSVAMSALRFASSAVSEIAGAPPHVLADLALVSSSLEYVDNLLTGMLDLSKVSAGKLRLHPQPCSVVRDVLVPVVRMLGGGEGGLQSHRHQQGAQGTQGPTLTVDDGAQVVTGGRGQVPLGRGGGGVCDPLWVEVDCLRLKQVCVNLVKNALKFVGHGFVKLGAKRVSDSVVELWVEDSGPGVPRAKAEALFDKFTQLHAHDNGTGLGLALCREISEAMGGSITVDTSYTSGSAHGPGARFVVQLPLPPCSEPQASTKASRAPPLPPPPSPSSPSSAPKPASASAAPPTKKVMTTRSASSAVNYESTPKACQAAAAAGGGTCMLTEDDDCHAQASIATSLFPPHKIRGPYRALVVSNQVEARKEIVQLLSRVGDGWRAVVSSTHDQSAIAGIAGPVDLVVLHHPPSEAAIAETLSLLRGSGNLAGGAMCPSSSAQSKPVVAVVVDSPLPCSGSGPFEGEEEGGGWRAAGADLVWHTPLPAPFAATPSLASLLPLPLRWRVLVADDVPMVRRLLVRTLKAALGSRCDVAEAANCKEALAAITQAAAQAAAKDATAVTVTPAGVATRENTTKEGCPRPETPFDLIVLDQHMEQSDSPGGMFGGGGGHADDATSGGRRGLSTGTDLARYLRSQGSTAIIAGFSGDDMEDEHFAAGCDLSWQKTIKAKTMSDDLLQCLRAGHLGKTVTF